jgi:hypothetical protein
MSGNDTEKRLQHLTDVLDVYGSAPRRWPDAERDEWLAFIAENKAAAKIVAEARALDRLLGLAPDGNGGGGLEARILAAATQLPQQGMDGAVVTLHRRPAGDRALMRPVAAARRMWPELTLLAASLFIGLVIGLSGQVLPALQDVAFIADSDGLGPISGLLFDAGGPDQEAL